MGNRKQPFGYRMEMGEIVLHPQEAKVVEYIFLQYTTGATYNTLVAELRNQPVLYDKGKAWNKNMVARILEDTRYTGQSGYPAIIRQEMHTAIDAAMSTVMSQMELYCTLGRLVSNRPEKGAAVAAAEYLAGRHPDVTGFSPRNLRRMRDFYRMYEKKTKLLKLAMEIGWTQNVVILKRS